MNEQTSLNSYQVLESIHRSRRFSLYYARKMDSGQEVLIKTPDSIRSKDANLIKALMNEAETAKLLSHPNIRSCYDSRDEEGGAFLIGEYIAGQSLSQVLGNASEPIALSLVMNWLLQMLDALEHAHTREIYHLNLNPYNLLVDNEQQIHIIGFGKGKNSWLNGEDGYMPWHPVLFVAPETFQAGQMHPTSDFYALAAIVYLMLCQSLPWRIDTQLSYEQQKQQSLCRAVIMPEILKKEVPDWLFSLLLSCLKLDPNQRPATVHEIREAIKAAGYCSPESEEAEPEIIPSEPEPSTSLEAEPEENIVTIPEVGSETAVIAETEPFQLKILDDETEQEAEPIPEPVPETEPAIESEPEQQSEPVPETVPAIESEPEQQTEPIPEPAYVPEPLPEPEAETEDEPFIGVYQSLEQPLPEVQEPEPEPNIATDKSGFSVPDADHQIQQPLQAVDGGMATAHTIPDSGLNNLKTQHAVDGGMATAHTIPDIDQTYPKHKPSTPPAPQPSKPAKPIGSSAPLYQNDPYRSKQTTQRVDDTHSLQKTFRLLLWMVVAVVAFVILKYAVFAHRPKFETPAQEEPLEEPVKPAQTTNVPITMILVPADTLVMGNTAAGAESDEFPLLTVRVNKFYISAKEITQKEWLMVYPDNPSGNKNEALPVENITFYEAVEFCNAKSLKDGFQPCYDFVGDEVSCSFEADGYRLPTEAEWEFAAKAGQRYKFNTYSGGEYPNEVGWYNANSDAQSHPVGKKSPNPLGIYDLSGNVYEWVWNWYAPYSYRYPEPAQGPLKGTDKVIRGGSWYHDASSMRVSDRYHAKPFVKTNYIGFRVVRSVID